ncbi:hypothetical protein [Nostoc sp. UHCC 0252]|nr:hypothetical protein [Nostoc sp. UHCC 0252]MEA5600911.1 hypothetical protein [Nostoc sp. UHCC 0252]
MGYAYAPTPKRSRRSDRLSEGYGQAAPLHKKLPLSDTGKGLITAET